MMDWFTETSFLRSGQAFVIFGWIMCLSGTIQLWCRSEADVEAIGRIRKIELVMNVFGLILFPIGALRGWLWFFDIRRRLADLDRAAQVARGRRDLPRKYGTVDAYSPR